MVSHTEALIAESMVAHDHNCEEQNTLSSPQLYRHSQEQKKWLAIRYIAHCRVKLLGFGFEQLLFGLDERT